MTTITRSDVDLLIQIARLQIDIGVDLGAGGSKSTLLDHLWQTHLKQVGLVGNSMRIDSLIIVPIIDILQNSLAVEAWKTEVKELKKKLAVCEAEKQEQETKIQAAKDALGL